MKVPKNIVVTTKDYIQIMTQVNLFISIYGCEAVRQYLNTIPLKHSKKEGRNAGAYIINKICQDYRITQYDLFESNERKELTQARQLLCVLIEKHLGFNKTQISTYFNRSRHFAKRMIGKFQVTLKENHKLDQQVIDRYKKLDRLITAYMAFKPNTKL
jgi:chromosomal replication initiation ATPase DnaA